MDKYPLPSDLNQTDRDIKMEGYQEERKNVNFAQKNLEKLQEMQERKDKELKKMEDERNKVLKRQEKLK